MIAKIRPSSFPAWSQCPSFTPDEGATAEAEEGKAAHDALMRAIRGESCDGGEHAEVVEWARAEILKTAGDAPLETERDVSYADMYVGRADVVGPDEIWEFKLGGDVHRPYAYQIAGYVLAVASERGLPGMWGTLLLGGVRRAVRSYYSLSDAAALVGYAVGVHQQHGGTLYRQCDYCGYCACADTCPALAVPSAAVADLRGSLSVEAWRQRLADVAHPSRITDPEVMALALDVSQCVSDWVDSVKHHALRMALGGNVPPGYALQARRGREQIPADVVAERIGAWALSGVKVSVSQVTRAIADARGTNEGQARDVVAAAVGDCIEVGEESRFLRRIRR